MGRTDENDVGPSSRFSRRPLTKKRMALVSILLVATLIMGAMTLYILGNPEVVAVADVMPDPEGSESFFLEEGKYQVWHLVGSPASRVEVWGPGNHRYFRGYVDSGSDSGIWRSDEYRMIGTFDGDQGKYQVFSEEGDNVLIVDTTIVMLPTLLFGTLLAITIVYGIYIIPPKKVR
jgi:hypothetical protein